MTRNAAPVQANRLAVTSRMSPVLTLARPRAVFLLWHSRRLAVAPEPQSMAAMMLWRWDRRRICSNARSRESSLCDARGQPRGVWILPSATIVPQHHLHLRAVQGTLWFGTAPAGCGRMAGASWACRRSSSSCGKVWQGIIFRRTSVSPEPSASCARGVVMRCHYRAPRRVARR